MRLSILTTSLLFISASTFGQVNSDIDSELSDLIGGIILSYQKTEKKEFKIKYTWKFGSQRPHKSTFHYLFENDSVLSHFTQYSVWFNDKSEITRYKIRGNEFLYMQTSEDSLYYNRHFNDNPRTYWKVIRSGNLQNETIYKISNGDSVIVSRRTYTYDSLNRETSFFLWNYQNLNEGRKDETHYTEDSIIKKRFHSKDSIWDLYYYHILTTKKSTDTTTITDVNLLLSKDTKSDTTITTICYDKNHRVTKITRIETTDYIPENIISSIERDILEVSFPKPKKK